MPDTMVEDVQADVQAEVEEIIFLQATEYVAPRDCPICLEPLTEREWGTTLCDHDFHLACLRQWAKQAYDDEDPDAPSASFLPPVRLMTDRCPMCKAKLQGSGGKRAYREVHEGSTPPREDGPSTS